MLGHKLRNNPFETYRVEMKDSAFCFVISRTFFEYLCTMVTRVELRKDFLAIRREEGDQLVTFFVDLPFITYPNYAHKSLNWKSLRLCVKQISLLLDFFNCAPKEQDFFISKEPQLVCIETGYRTDAHFHACPLTVGYSDSICKLLSIKYTQDTHMAPCEEIAFDVYQTLSSKRKRDFEKEKKVFLEHGGGFTGITVKVRGGGVPHFIVPGNCACLGENPDDFRCNRDMQSHNLDTPLQQITILAAVVSFWNDVLRPLYVEEKAKETLPPS